MVGKRRPECNLTKFYALVLLKDKARHGYELIEELGKKLGKKPSAGQIYPLLSNFEKQGLVKVKEKDVGGRVRKVYHLTAKGKKTTDRLIERMSGVISVILEKKLNACAHCGCKVYEGGFKKGRLMFCCSHCAKHHKKHS